MCYLALLITHVFIPHTNLRSVKIHLRHLTMWGDCAAGPGDAHAAAPPPGRLEGRPLVPWALPKGQGARTAHAGSDKVAVRSGIKRRHVFIPVWSLRERHSLPGHPPCCTGWPVAPVTRYPGPLAHH